MECTQRLFTTQDQDNACEQQIGYLAVNGITYPIIIGHNKIGRDPQMCNLVLNMDTVSRQHALINILNEKDFTLMDLGSANKTKLRNYPGSDYERKFMTDTIQILNPYIPYPLKKGATIQFGLVQAVFNLLEDDNDLPATQVLDVPATPENFAKASKPWLNAAVTIPESPDKDDSFVIPSQPHKKPSLNNNLHFVKPSNKMLSIQPVGSNKIDNVYWKSSKKSKSFSPSCSLNILDLPPPESKKDDIYEMETQDLFGERNDEIYSAETQIPHSNVIINNISMLPPPKYDTNIHEMETQAPNPRDDEPALSVHSHKAESAIHSLDTQIILPKKLDMNNQQEIQLDLNLSDKENSDSIYNAETQSFTHKEPSLIESGSNDDSNLSKVNKKSRMTVNTSDDDLTDCEDLDLLLTQPLICKKDGDLTNTENIGKLETTTKENDIVVDNIEDQATQILDCNTTANTNNEVPFEDMLTQVLIEDIPKLTKDTSVDINQRPENFMTPFKIPLKSNSRPKKKDTTKVKEITLRDDQYYKLTQDIYDDLCSQKQQSLKTFSDTEKTKDEVLNQNNEILPCTRKHYVGEKSNPHIEAQLLSPKSTNSSSDDGVNAFVSNLSRQEVCDMIGVQVAPLQKMPNDGSDVDVTPKKSKPFAFSDSEMPSSQDIKASVSSLVQCRTETSSESESECSEDQNTPVLFRPKKKPKIDAKKDLTKSFDIHALPSRVMIRNRKEIFDERVDTQIIQENIIRLKNKSEKKKDHKKSTKDTNATKLKNDNDNKSNKSTKKENKDTSNKKDKKSNINIRQLNENTSTSARNYVNKTKSKIETECDTHDSKKEPRKTEMKCNVNTNAVLASDNDDTLSRNKGSTKSEGGMQYSKYKKSVHKNEVMSNSDAASTSKNSDTLSKQKSQNKSLGDTQYSKHKKPDNKMEVKSNSDATSESKSSVTRRTRSTRQQKLEVEQTSKSISPERNTSRKSQRKKIDTKRYSPTTDKETEVRRSKRQRTIKEYQPVKELKSILKNTDQSTVYNVSSELNSDCSKNLKRSVETDIEGPSSKRSRGVHANSSSIRSTPVRGIKTHYVLFTAFPSEPVRHKLETLGAKVVSDVKECTVVITIQLRRTFKLLCAVGLGKPIVGPNWVQACVDTNMIVDPWLYLMQDEEYEKKFQFSLARTLKGNRNFLKGYNISSTPSVIPPPNEMKLIVECSGGTWQEGGAKWVCVSCKADMHLWPAIRKRGATIVTAEFVLGGALRQRLDIAGNAFK